MKKWWWSWQICHLFFYLPILCIFIFYFTTEDILTSLCFIVICLEMENIINVIWRVVRIQIKASSMSTSCSLIAQGILPNNRVSLRSLTVQADVLISILNITCSWKEVSSAHSSYKSVSNLLLGRIYIAYSRADFGRVGNNQAEATCWWSSKPTSIFKKSSKNGYPKNNKITLIFIKPEMCTQQLL